MIKKLKSYNFRNYNFILVFLVVVLSAIGVIVVDSAGMSAGYEKKQLFGLIIGFVGMVIVSLIDYRFIEKFYWLIYLFNIFLLGLVFVMGKKVNGATRWIVIGGDNSGLSIQPSEFAKLFIILFLAKFLSKNIKHINNIKFLLITALLVAVPLGLIVSQPDLSTTILTCTIILSLIYCSGLSYKIIGIALGIAIPVALGCIIYIQQPNQKLLEPYQKRRIMAFIDPENYADDRYQQDNSVLAIGSGQLYGKGLNNDDPTSVKNAGFLPEPQTDFIFAIVGEELGFVGCIVILSLMFLIIVQCLIIGLRAPDLNGRLIAMGISSQLIFQTFINIGVTTELLPNTGVTLPFVSYGLSSLIALFGGMGVMLNISLNRKTR